MFKLGDKVFVTIGTEKWSGILHEDRGVPGPGWCRIWRIRLGARQYILAMESDLTLVA